MSTGASSPSRSSRSSSTTGSTRISLRSRRGRVGYPFGSSSSSPLMLLLFAMLALFAGSARSVLISTFDNCIDDDVLRSPTHLQFHPLVVAAAFGIKARGLLQITVWGNVTGENASDPRGQQRRDLGGSREWREGDWALLRERDGTQSGNNSVITDRPGTLNWGQVNVRNPTFDGDVQYRTSGQIVHLDPLWKQPKATTLWTSVQIASFDMPVPAMYFCQGPGATGNASASCPMGSTTGIKSWNDAHNLTVLMRELPSFTWERDFDTSYSFVSIDTRFSIVSGDKAHTQIGCIRVEVTPLLGGSNDAALTWVPAGVLALVALGTVLAAMLNPWVGTTDIFRWSSNHGMDEDMIRLVTPGFADCLQWLQFFVLTGSLSLSYPGFYQPVVSRVAWSALLFNTSLFSHDPVSQQIWNGDGIYALDASAYGLERLAQAVGLRTVDDVWVCVMAFFGVVAIGTVIMPQLWFAGRWATRKAMGREEGDLTNKSLPFTYGMLNRITFTYFLTPILAASAFLLTTVGRASNTIVALAASLVFIIITVAILLTIRIWNHKPRSTLFDHLPTLLTFGTFYNTYREKNLKFFIVQLFVNIGRAIAFGALQPSGIAQITILAICEIVLILTVCGIKPYARATSMNAWQAIFAVVRLLTILLMMAFVPSMDAQEAAKTWIGYVILVIHGLVLIFGFFFMAVQTLLELFIRGCGGADEGEAARGGLAKVFGMRQLSRRKHKQHRGSVDPSIINVSDDHKISSTINSRPVGVGPMSRTGSSAVLLGGPSGSAGAPGMMDVGSQSNHHHSGSGSTGFTPTTPGAASNFSYLGAGGAPLALDTGPTNVAGPYYRPPRVKGGTYGPRNLGEGSGSDNYSPGTRSGGSWGSGMWVAAAADAQEGAQRSSQGSLPNGPDDLWNEAPGPSSGTGTPQGATVGSARGGVLEPLAHRHTESSLTAGSVRNSVPTDYAVREMDFYYGVRGPALNSQTGRRLGTGPADPTGPVAVTKGWLWKRLGWGLRGKKETGFTVVRSSRAPEALLDAEREAKGIGMAVTSHTPPVPDSDSSSDDSGDEEEGGKRSKRQKTPSPMSQLTSKSNKRRKTLSLLSQNSDSDNEADSDADDAAGPSSRMLEKQPAYDGSSGPSIELKHSGSIKPQVPRKSSKRKSASFITTNQQQREQQQPVSPPDSPVQARLLHHPYDPPPQLHHAHPRHPLYDQHNLSPSRLPFSSEESTHTRSISTSSSLLPPPPEILADDNALSRPPSVGTVHRYRMEDMMRNSTEVVGRSAEVVEGGRGGSL